MFGLAGDTWQSALASRGRSDRRMAVLGMPLVPLVTEGVHKRV